MNNSSIVPAVDKVYVTDNVAYVAIANLPNDGYVLPHLFGEIAAAHIKLDLITQILEYTNKMSVSFSLDDADFMKLSPVLKQLRTDYADIDISASTGNTKISVFGKEINEYVGVAKAIFDILAECDVHPKVISTSEKDISILLNEMNEDEIISKLNTAFSL